MRCDAPSFSPADYDHIMQCAEKKPRDKVLKDLTDKYRTSQKRIYQIWRGEEKNRVAWNQPIHMSTAGPGGTASLSNINVVSGQIEPKIQGQDVSPFTELEKMGIRTKSRNQNPKNLFITSVMAHVMDWM